MRKLKHLVVLLMAVLLVSGCKMKAEYNMAIKSDKSMDLSVIIGMDDELLEMMLSDDDNNSNASYTEADKWKYLEESLDIDKESKNFKVEKYTENGFKGYKLTTNVKNIDDISGSKGAETISDSNDLVNKELFVKKGDKYSLNIKLEDVDDVTSQASSSDLNGVSLDSIFDMKFIISLPNKPIKHNATSVSDDGKTLTWDLIKNANKPIELEFELNGKTSNNQLLLYGGIALAAIVVIVVIVIISGNKKKGNPAVAKTVEQNPNPQVDSTINTPVQPVQPTVAPTNPVPQPQPQPAQPAQPINQNPVEQMPNPSMPQVSPMQTPVAPVEQANSNDIVTPQATQPDNISSQPINENPNDTQKM